MIGTLPIASTGSVGVAEAQRLTTVFGPVCFYLAARPRI